MRVQPLLQINEISNIRRIKTNCSQFLLEANGMPLFKYLPNTHDDFQKIKVRKHNNTTKFGKVFNSVFKEQLYNLRERAVFAIGGVEDIYENENELFYVFPPNGFRYMYSKAVNDSTNCYEPIFESIFNKLGETSGTMIFEDLLRFNYSTEQLSEGISSGAEIILYGIPYYYALRVTTISNYAHLTTNS